MIGRKSDSQAGKRGGERTPELTGTDADISEALVGSAGNGASPHGGDLAGARELEDPPDAEDISPDRVGRFRESGEEQEDETEVTARPRGATETPFAHDEETDIGPPPEFGVEAPSEA